MYPKAGSALAYTGLPVSYMLGWSIFLIMLGITILVLASRKIAHNRRLSFMKMR